MILSCIERENIFILQFSSLISLSHSCVHCFMASLLTVPKHIIVKMREIFQNNFIKHQLQHFDFLFIMKKYKKNSLTAYRKRSSKIFQAYKNYVLFMFSLSFLLENICLLHIFHLIQLLHIKFYKMNREKNLVSNEKNQHFLSVCIVSLQNPAYFPS